MLQVRGLHSYLNHSCTERISVKRSIGIHPTKKGAHWTTATHLHCIKDQIKAAPCAAYLSSQFLETAQLRNYKNWITCHLHICTRSRGWGLWQKKKNLTGFVQPGPVHFKGKDDSCVGKGALHSSFGLFWKIKQAEKDPTPLQYRTNYPYLNASITSQFPKIEHCKFKNLSPQDQSLLPNNIKGIQLICPSTSLLKNAGHIRALHISKLYSHLKKAQESFPHTTPKEQMHTNCIQSHKAMHLLCNKKILYR